LLREFCVVFAERALALVFGDCVFDPGARSLTRAGRALALSPKAFELLLALLDARPRALSRAELHDRLWPGTFVSHYSLPRVVAEVRRALGDRRHPAQFLRTVHGFGYSFCGEAQALAGPAAPPSPPGSRFGIVWKSRTLPLVSGEILIGRDPECAVRIDLPLISRRHARIRIEGNVATLEDLGSKNGTSMGGRRVSRPTHLADGAEIVVGSEVLVFRDSGPLRSTRTGPARVRSG
jgi:DNA-binding winged helix-turn-helix (wHTH) protein